MVEINGFEIENEVNGFSMENEDKLSRVIFGNMGRAGELVGGMGIDEAESKPEEVLARYDRLAGLIRKNGVKIKTGSFWDFKLKKPREVPQIMFVYNIGGEFVEVEDPSRLAEAITLVETTKKKKEEKIKERLAKSKSKKLK